MSSADNTAGRGSDGSRGRSDSDDEQRLQQQTQWQRRIASGHHGIQLSEALTQGFILLARNHIYYIHIYIYIYIEDAACDRHIHRRWQDI